MVFGFYYRLNATRRRVYERSDQLGSPPPRLNPWLLAPFATKLQQALVSEQQTAVQIAAQALADAVVEQLGLPAVQISVLRTRPQRGGAEYHGYYEGAESGKMARIRLWMLTARRRQVVAYRTFLRTLVHELCHHLDFEGFLLSESFHTEGFYQRESAIFRAIVGDSPAVR